MKHTLAILLLTASVVFGQLFTNTNLDGVTNSTVNGVLDDDAAASRTALGLGTAATLEDTDPTKINPGVITLLAGSGDSITATGALNGIYQVGWFTSALMVSEKEIPLAYNGTALNFGVGGHTTTNWLATQVPAITSLVTKPSHVITMIGTNDVATNVSTSVAMTNIRAGIVAFRAAGITPIFVTIAPAPRFNIINRSILYSQVEIFNTELINLCSELRVRIEDVRKVGEIPEIPGAAYQGSFFDESPWLGIHPQGQWHMRVGKQVGRMLNQYSTAPSVWDFDIINAQPGWETTTPTIYQGTYQTAVASRNARTDGAGGNILRVVLTKSTVKQIGSGNSGYTFTPVAPNTEVDYEVHVQNPPAFGVNNPVPGTPYVTVQPILGTGRRLVLVKLEATTSYVTTSTAQQVINAINSHAVASTICVAASTGTPGSTIAAGGNTYEQSSLNSIIPATAEVNFASTDYIRGVVEVWNPRGATTLGVYLSAIIAPTTPAYHTVCSGMFPIPLPEGRAIICTPWVLASTSRRLYLSIYFGQSEGIYRFGRCEIQRKAP